MQVPTLFDSQQIRKSVNMQVPTLFVGNAYTTGAVNTMGVQKMQQLVEGLFSSLLFENGAQSTVKLLLRALLSSRRTDLIGFDGQADVVSFKVSDEKKAGRQSGCTWVLLI